jgi:hypothetical protein
MLNAFLATILIMIYHVFVGAFISRSSLAYTVSLYIFVLVMVSIIGTPTDESTGELKYEPVSTLR